MRPPSPAPLSEAQLEIMNIVWDHEEVTVAGVREVLQSRRPIARNTVQTTIVRLVEKGWLRHREDAGRFYYRATVDRESSQRQLVRRVLDTAFGGSTAGLVLALLDGQRLKPEEAKRIRSLIEEAEARE